MLRYILKYTVRSGKQLSVAALIGDIRHGAVDITGSDAVSGGLRLLAQGYHILKIILGGKAARLSPVLFVVAALIHKEAAEVEPTLFARAAVQTHKSELYLGMTRGSKCRGILPAKNCFDKLGIAAHKVEESALARRLIVGCCRFDEMSRAVELVMVAVGKALAGLDHSVPDVKISVGSHVSLNAVNQLLDIAFEFGVTTL